MNEVIQTIKSRRSVRAYRSDPLKKAELDILIEAGIYAPSGHNQQAWHFTVIQDREVIGSINQKCKELMANVKVDWIKNIAENPKHDITYNAPVLLIVSARRGALTGNIDCTAAMLNMMLAAESLNIGSCWMGLISFIFGDEEETAKLGIPEDYEPQVAAVFGYKADDTKQDGPPRRRDVVNYVGKF